MPQPSPETPVELTPAQQMQAQMGVLLDAILDVRATGVPGQSVREEIRGRQLAILTVAITTSMDAGVRMAQGLSPATPEEAEALGKATARFHGFSDPAEMAVHKPVHGGYPSPNAEE